MFEAVIFDWDGTLADTRAAIVSSFQETLKEINVSVSGEYIGRRMGIGAAETFRDILREANKPFDEVLIKRLVERKNQVQISLKEQVQLFPGARELLVALHGKAKVGLASMNSKPVIDALVKATGLEKYFQTIFTVEDVSHSKPHPEIFLKCAQQLNVMPLHCVVVEDSIFGVKAAKAAEMNCIVVTTGAYSGRELEKEKPDLIVSTLTSAEVISFILS